MAAGLLATGGVVVLVIARGEESLDTARQSDMATHVIPHPAPGTYAVRALCKTAHAKSDWCTPVVITI